MTKTLTEQQIRKIIENVTEKAAKVCEKKFYEKPKSLTEQWREGTLESGHYYIQWSFDCDPRPRNMIDFFDKGYSDGGEFMLQQHKYIDEVLAPVPDYMDWKRLMNDSIELDKAKIKIYELVSKNEQFVQKIHILNEQNTKQYNELCEEIKKNNILEKKLKIATKALKEMIGYPPTNFPDCETYMWAAQQALKEMEGVK